jgi:hypothetical protein
MNQYSMVDQATGDVIEFIRVFQVIGRGGRWSVNHPSNEAAGGRAATRGQRDENCSKTAGIRPTLPPYNWEKVNGVVQTNFGFN